jgi:Ca2+-binding EF-hand superfamily protein
MYADYDSPELKEAFDLIDYNKEGTIDITEAIQTLKDNDFDKESPVIFGFLQTIGEGKYTYPQFEKKVNEILAEETADAGLKQTFDLFVNDLTGSAITLDALKRICKELGETFNNGDVEYIVNEVGDGNSINYEQFVKFMKKKINV